MKEKSTRQYRQSYEAQTGYNRGPFLLVSDGFEVLHLVASVESQARRAAAWWLDTRQCGAALKLFTYPRVLIIGQGSE